MTWKEFKDFIEEEGVTDEMHIQSIRQINPGTNVDEIGIYISEDSESFSVD